MSQMSKQTSPEERQKALAVALAQIEKQFGKGTIMRLGANDHDQVQVISTRSLALDKALGVGGLPRGRVVEIYGPESSGKTTLTLSVIAESQANGLVCAFVDAEHALDVQYAASLGVNVSDLLINQPDNAEQALEVIDALVRSGAVDVVILDSVAALVPKAELEGEMGDSLPGLNARLMSQALRKLTASIKQTNTLVIFINQIRMKIGVMFGCFHYDSPVLLADGTTQKIGHIVDNKLPVEVLSFNGNTNRIEPRKITNWFDNGIADNFLQITLTNNETSTLRTLIVTPNHTIFTPNGEVCANELAPGDLVLTSSNLQTTSPETVLSSTPVILPNMRKFDLEIDGNHSYLIDGIIVHNSPETTTGGNALKFYASVRLDIRRTGSVKKGDEIIGNETKVKVVKNKVAPPFKEAHFEILYGKGINSTAEAVDLAVELKLLDKAGSWYSYNGSKIAQGKDKACEYFNDNPPLLQALIEKVRAANSTPKT